MWIGIGPDKATLHVSSVQDAGCAPQAFTAPVQPGTALPNPFGGTMYPSCSLDAYLGP